jgi:hypothetical protein
MQSKDTERRKLRGRKRRPIKRPRKRGLHGKHRWRPGMGKCLVGFLVDLLVDLLRTLTEGALREVALREGTLGVGTRSFALLVETSILLGRISALVAETNSEGFRRVTVRCT